MEIHSRRRHRPVEIYLDKMPDNLCLALLCALFFSWIGAALSLAHGYSVVSTAANWITVVFGCTMLNAIVVFSDEAVRWPLVLLVPILMPLSKTLSGEHVTTQVEFIVAGIASAFACFGVALLSGCVHSASVIYKIEIEISFLLVAITGVCYLFSAIFFFRKVKSK